MNAESEPKTAPVQDQALKVQRERSTAHILLDIDSLGDRDNPPRGIPDLDHQAVGRLPSHGYDLSV